MQGLSCGLVDSKPRLWIFQNGIVQYHCEYWNVPVYDLCMSSDEHVVSVDELARADLRVGGLYGGVSRGRSVDPISRLLKVGARGGIRGIGSATRDQVKLVALCSNGQQSVWPDHLDNETGVLTYFGDNRTAGRSLLDTNLRGNVILRNAFAAAQGSEQDRERVPPFFYFEQVDERGPVVRFCGLAVPGGPEIRSEDSLIEITHRVKKGDVQNYQAKFTILNEPIIYREWIDSLVAGNPALAGGCPDSWKEWVVSGTYSIVYGVDFHRNPRRRQTVDVREIELNDNNPDYRNLVSKLKKFGGVVLTGPSGTGKSWLASQAALLLTEGDPNRYAIAQFHPSYQFEDFMEGYRPSLVGSGFELQDGVFLRLVDNAYDNSSKTHVMVIDELNRADVARVFGEALTYIDRSKRGHRFLLPSGRPCSIPPNLWIIATMNPADRGVDELDSAFERRFAKVQKNADRNLLQKWLSDADLNEDIVRRVVSWFDRVNSLERQMVPGSGLGHAYFYGVDGLESLQELWDCQLQFHIDRAFEHDRGTRDSLKAGWPVHTSEAVSSPTGNE